MRSATTGVRQESYGTAFGQQQQSMTMYKTKKEVDIFADSLNKQNFNETERMSRFFGVARAYASVREFSLAKRYLQTYIEYILPNTTLATSSRLGEAYKVMGDILMDLNEKESALNNYKKSYELIPNRVTLNRVCDLLQNGFGEDETPESKKNWFTLQKTAATAATNGVSSPSFGRNSGSAKSPIYLPHNGGGELSLYQLKTQQRSAEITPQSRRPSNSAFEVEFTKHLDKKLDDVTVKMKEQMGTIMNQMGTIMEQMGKLMDQNISVMQTISSTDSEVKGLKDQIKSLEATVNSSTSEFTKNLMSRVVEKADVEEGKQIPGCSYVTSEPCKDLKEQVDKLAAEIKSSVTIDEATTTLPKAEQFSKSSTCSPVNNTLNPKFEASSVNVKPPPVTKVQTPTTPQFSFGFKNPTEKLGVADIGYQNEIGKGFSFGTPTLGSSIFSVPVAPIFGQKPKNFSNTSETTGSAAVSRTLDFGQASQSEKGDGSSSSGTQSLTNSYVGFGFVEPVTHSFGQILKPTSTVATPTTTTSVTTKPQHGYGDTTSQGTKSGGFSFATSTFVNPSIFPAPATSIFGQNSYSAAATSVTGTASKTPTFGDLANQSEKMQAGYSFGKPSKGSSVSPTPMTPIFGQKPATNAVAISADGNEDREDEFVPTAEFIPVIPLPPLVEVKKGDENEKTIYEVRAKLLRLYDDEKENKKEWKERGVGNIKILQDKEKSTKVRIVMWRERIHTLACNHWIDGDTTVTYFNQTDKNLKWSAMDFSEGEPRKELFACKFSKPEQCKEFKAHIDQLVAHITSSLPVDVSEHASPIGNPKPSSALVLVQKPTEPLKPLSEIFKNPVGSWTCKGCYNTNAKDCLKCPSCETLKSGVEASSIDPVASTQSAAIPPFSFSFKPIAGSLGFGDLASQSEKTGAFSFGTSKLGSSVFPSSAIPIFGQKMTTTTTITTNSTAQAPEGDDYPEEEFIPTAEFVPVIPLPPLVEVKKGDENENTVYEVRAKLLRLHVDEKENTKEWKERGIGNIKILQDKENKTKVRIVMWREQIYKLACNHWISKDTSVTFFNLSDKQLKWSAMDFAEGEPRREIFVCKFKKPEYCQEFKAHLDRLVAEIQRSSTTNSDKVDESSQKNSESLPPMTSTVILQKPSEPLPPLSELFKKPEGSWTCSGCYLSNTKDSLKCPSCETPKPGVEKSNVQLAPVELKPPATPQFSFGFKPVEGLLGFGDLASQSGKGFSFATPNSSSSLFSTVVTPIFGQKMTTTTPSTTNSPAVATEGGDHAEEEEFVPTAEFAPVVPLPPLVEVKKGDENYNTIYEVRAKLLRIHEDEKENKKEWKERGIGNIKILQDKRNVAKVRIVMWREQIYKLACNHWVDKDTSVTFFSGTDKHLMWSAMDFAEGEPKKEIFVCKFAKPEQCLEFKTHMDRLVAQIKITVSVNSAGTNLLSENSENAPAITEKFTEELKPLSELFKTPEGWWTCSGCYLKNTKDTVKCPSCETLKPGVVESSVKAEGPKKIAPQFTFGFNVSSTVPSLDDTSCLGCIGCEADNFDFTQLNNRKIPEYPEQTMSPEQYAEFLASASSEAKEDLAIFPFSSPLNASTSSSIVGLSSPVSTSSLATSSPATFFLGSPPRGPLFGTSSSSILADSPLKGVSFGTPSSSFLPGLPLTGLSFGTPTFNLGSPLISAKFTPPTQQFSIPVAVISPDEDDDEYEDVDEEDVEEEDEDDVEEPMFEGSATVQIRYPDAPEYSDLGKGSVSITYDNDLLCSRFVFLNDLDEVAVEHIICSDTHLQVIGDRTFAWAGLSETDERTFIKLELQATLETEDLYNTFLDRWTDSQDIASQASVTEEYLAEDDQGGD